jgi:flagellar hook-length control protein FliK
VASLIQLTALDQKGLNPLGKKTAKGNEESPAFEDLLLQIGMGEAEKNGSEEKLEVTELAGVTRYWITLPIERPFMEAASTPKGEAASSLQSTSSLSNSFASLSPKVMTNLLENHESKLIKQMDPMVVSIQSDDEKTITPQVDFFNASFFQDLAETPAQQKKTADTGLPQNLQQQFQQTAAADHTFFAQVVHHHQSDEMLGEAAVEDNRETPPSNGEEQPPLTGITPANNGPSVPTFTTRVDPHGKDVFGMPVRAEHLVKDLTSGLSTAIDIQKLKEGFEAYFTLKPEHLGKVDVKVFIHEGNVTAEFFTSTPLGRDLLETQVHALRTALEQQGLQVNKIDISQQNTQFSEAFSQKGDSQTRQGQQESRKRNSQTFITSEEEYPDYTAENISISQINTTA